MTPLEMGIVAVIAVVGLLLARGMWLLGRGSHAERAARVATSDSTVASTGWTTLDMLQVADVPIVTSIENRLGINQDEEEEEDE